MPRIIPYETKVRQASQFLRRDEAMRAALEEERLYKAQEQVEPYKTPEGLYDIGAARQAGVPEDILELVFGGETIAKAHHQEIMWQESLITLEPYKDAEGKYNVGAALQGGIPEKTLLQLFGEEAVFGAKTGLEKQVGYQEILTTLEPYKIDETHYNIQAARQAGIPEDIIVQVFGAVPGTRAQAMINRIQAGTEQEYVATIPITQVLTNLFPNNTIEDVDTWAQEKPDEFWQYFMTKGRTPDTEAFLKFSGYTPEDIDRLYAELTPPLSERQIQELYPGEALSPSEMREEKVPTPEKLQPSVDIKGVPSLGLELGRGGIPPKAPMITTPSGNQVAYPMTQAEWASMTPAEKVRYTETPQEWLKERDQWAKGRVAEDRIKIIAETLGFPTKIDSTTDQMMLFINTALWVLPIPLEKLGLAAYQAGKRLLPKGAKESLGIVEQFLKRIADIRIGGKAEVKVATDVAEHIKNIAKEPLPEAIPAKPTEVGVTPPTERPAVVPAPVTPEVTKLVPDEISDISGYMFSGSASGEAQSNWFSGSIDKALDFAKARLKSGRGGEPVIRIYKTSDIESKGVNKLIDLMESSGKQIPSSEYSMMYLKDIKPTYELKLTKGYGTTKEDILNQLALPKAPAPEVVPPVGIKEPIPSVEGVKPTTPLGKIQTMLETKPVKVRDWSEARLKLQENINDSYYGLRRLQTRIGKAEPIKAGTPLDITTAITRAPGAANAGLGRYELAISRMKRIAPDANVTDINTILFVEHGKEVLAAKGAKRVLAGGVNTPAELDMALAELRTKLGDEAYKKVYSAAEVVKDVYSAERGRLVDAGLISKKLGDELATKYPWYNPMRYLDYAEVEASRGKSAKPFSVWFSGLKRLGEVGSEEAIQNPITQLSQELIRNEVRIQKNQLASGIIDLAMKDQKLGVSKMKITVPVAQREGEPIFGVRHGEIPGTLSRMVEGIREVYQVPDWMYREAVVLNQSVNNPAVSFIGALNGISRAAFTSASPVFTVANIFNDMLPAFIRGGVTPLQTAKRWMFSFHSLEKDPLMQAYKLSGALQARFYGKEAVAIAEEVGATGGKVIGKNFNFGKAVRDAIPNFGQRGEQASREAIFERSLGKALPNWREISVEKLVTMPEVKKAAAEAVEGTINFGRGGYLIRSANPLVIFLNASFEGTKLPFRALAENPAAKWRLAGAATGVAGVTAYNMSYPEYLDVPLRTRLGTVMIMLPSDKKDINGKIIPKYLTIIPNTREWASFFAPIVYGMEKVFRDSPETFLQVAQNMIPQVSPISNIPLPPLVGEVAQQMANYDFYFGTKIVSQGKENLPVIQQTGPYVSSTVEKVSGWAGLSPLRVQHALQSIFGGAGTAILSVTDLVVGVKNKQGLDLKAQYDTLPPEKRAEWLNGLSSADKSALNSAYNQPQQPIPIISTVVSRFYHERGGQLNENDWNTWDKVSNDTNTEFDTIPEMKELNIRLGMVGDSIDLIPGLQGGSIDLTVAERTSLQQTISDYIIPRMKEFLTTLDPKLSGVDRKNAIEKELSSLKVTARDEFIKEYRTQNVDKVQPLIDSRANELANLLGTQIGEPVPGSNEPPKIYDMGNLWTAYTPFLAYSTPEKTKNPLLKSRIQAQESIDTLKTIPNKKLTSLNNKPFDEKGNPQDTYKEWYQQWQYAQSITDPVKREAYLKTAPNAHLGNISRIQMALLDKYFSLTGKEQEQFAIDNAEELQNPQNRWAGTHTQDSAELSIWGKWDITNKATYDNAVSLIKEYDVPPDALTNLPPAGSIDNYFKYNEMVVNHENTSAAAKLMLYEDPDLLKFLGLEPIDESRIPIWRIDVKYTKEDKEYDALPVGDARTNYLTANDDYRLDRRRREAYQKGLATGLIEPYVSYYELPETGYRRDRFLLNNPDFAQAIGLDVPDRVPSEEYDNLLEKPDRTPEDDLRMDAYKIYVPDNQIENYVGYKTLPKGTYEKDWFMMEHMGFYREVYLGILGNEKLDFTKVPMTSEGKPDRRVFQKYLFYLTLVTQKSKDDYRFRNQDLDRWGQIAFGWTPITEKKRRAELTPYEKFQEEWEEKQKEIEKALK